MRLLRRAMGRKEVVLAMFLLLNGFSLLGMNPFWQVIIVGLILIYVVGQEGITRQVRLLFGKHLSIIGSTMGTQADFDASGRWTGVIMEYLLRDVLAERGQKVVIDEQGTKQATPLGDPAELLKAVNVKEWNDYTVIAKGGRVVLQINGVTMCELEDRDPKRPLHGWLAVQVHVGPPMRVQFKDIYLRRL